VLIKPLVIAPWRWIFFLQLACGAQAATGGRPVARPAGKPHNEVGRRRLRAPNMSGGAASGLGRSAGDV